MPGLVQSFKNHDSGFLHIVAELWGINIASIKESELSSFLSQSILRQISNSEIFEKIPIEAHLALADLVQNQGALPWSLFTRRHGEVREMGAARRDRIKPHLSPISPVESLWYRGLVFREFQESPRGPEEYAYIPPEILAVIPSVFIPDDSTYGRPALPDECRIQFPANDTVLDDACTLLAGLRLEFNLQQLETIQEEWIILSSRPENQARFPCSTSIFIQLLHTADLLDEKDIPKPDTTRTFLENPRAEALSQLFHSWESSTHFNELRMISSLSFEGNWQNDPLKARQAILSLLKAIPENTWWSLSSFVDTIHKKIPDFQRWGGEYDAWYIQSASSDKKLKGFEHWYEVEGELIHFILYGPLHWLGAIDLASSGDTTSILAFRITPWGRSLLSHELPSGLKAESQPVFAYADGRLRIPSAAPRVARYHISRFCKWEHKKAEEYHYRITPESLDLANQQGLRVNQLLSLLQRYASSIPPILTKAISRWEKYGCEARLVQVTVLRVRDVELISKLKKSKVARFLGDSLGPTSIIIKPGGWEKVQGFLAEQGYLTKGN